MLTYLVYFSKRDDSDSEYDDFGRKKKKFRSQGPSDEDTSDKDKLDLR